MFYGSEGITVKIEVFVDELELTLDFKILTNILDLNFEFLKKTLKFLQNF